MSNNPKKKGRNTRNSLAGEGQYFPMFEYVMASDAYRHLSNDAKALYVEFRRIAMKDKTASNRIAMSVRFAAGLIRVDKDRASKLLKELIDHGFIAVAQASAFSQKSAKATVYRITHLGSRDDRTMDFRAYQQATTKNKNRSLPRGPIGPPTGDSPAQSVPSQGTDGPFPGDRFGQITQSVGPPTGDTSRSSQETGVSGGSKRGSVEAGAGGGESEGERGAASATGTRRRRLKVIDGGAS